MSVCRRELAIPDQTCNPRSVAVANASWNSSSISLRPPSRGHASDAPVKSNARRVLLRSSERTCSVDIPVLFASERSLSFGFAGNRSSSALLRESKVHSTKLHGSHFGWRVVARQHVEEFVGQV
jgi:hypothetical protein